MNGAFEYCPTYLHLLNQRGFLKISIMITYRREAPLGGHWPLLLTESTTCRTKFLFVYMLQLRALVYVTPELLRIVNRYKLMQSLGLQQFRKAAWILLRIYWVLRRCKSVSFVVCRILYCRMYLDLKRVMLHKLRDVRDFRFVFKIVDLPPLSLFFLNVILR